MLNVPSILVAGTIGFGRQTSEISSIVMGLKLKKFVGVNQKDRKSVV